MQIIAGELVPATRVPEEYPLLWEGRQPAGRVTTLVVVVVSVAVVILVEVDVSVEVVTLVRVVVSVEVMALVRVVVCVAVVTEVAVTVVGGRDVGARIRVADTRTPATGIAAATYARLLFPLPCNARSLDSKRRSYAFGKYFCPNGANMFRPSRLQAKTLKILRRTKPEESLTTDNSVGSLILQNLK